MIVTIRLPRQTSLRLLRTAYQPMIDWCESQGLTNTREFWARTRRATWESSAGKTHDTVEFYFTDDSDYIASMFLLKFGGDFNGEMRVG